MSVVGDKAEKQFYQSLKFMYNGHSVNYQSNKISSVFVQGICVPQLYHSMSTSANTYKAINSKDLEHNKNVYS